MEPIYAIVKTISIYRRVKQIVFELAPSIAPKTFSHQPLVGNCLNRAATGSADKIQILPRITQGKGCSHGEASCNRRDCACAIAIST